MAGMHLTSRAWDRKGPDHRWESISWPSGTHFEASTTELRRDVRRLVFGCRPLTVNSVDSQTIVHAVVTRAFYAPQHKMKSSQQEVVKVPLLSNPVDFVLAKQESFGLLNNHCVNTTYMYKSLAIIQRYVVSFKFIKSFPANAYSTFNFKSSSPIFLLNTLMLSGFSFVFTQVQ